MSGCPPRVCLVERKHGSLDNVGELKGGVHSVKVSSHHAVLENLVALGTNQVGEGAHTVNAPEGFDSFFGLAFFILLDESFLYGLAHGDEGFVEVIQGLARGTFVFWSFCGVFRGGGVQGIGWGGTGATDEAKLLLDGFPNAIVVGDALAGGEAITGVGCLEDLKGVIPCLVACLENLFIREVKGHLFLVPTFAHTQDAMWGTVIQDEDKVLLCLADLCLKAWVAFW